MEMVQTGEFHEIAERLAREIADRGGVTVAELEEIIGLSGFPVNLYPSNEKGQCCHVAYFVSLWSNNNKKGYGHLRFHDMIYALIQHMQGHCVNNTKYGVIFTDTWNVSFLDDWKDNIEQIKHYAYLEAYFISNGQATRLPI